MATHELTSRQRPATHRRLQLEAATACARLLFRALVESDGDAAVMHTGNRPYLVTRMKEVEMATDVLTPRAVLSLTRSLLSNRALRTLRTSGLAHYDCPVLADLPRERFAVAASISPDGMWLEVRRLRVPERDAIPNDVPPAAAPVSG